VSGRAPARVSSRVSTGRAATGRGSAGRRDAGRRDAAARPGAGTVVIPVEPPARGSRGGFGRTWWGKAWIEALEQRAQLDPNRLPRGRTYARGGTVGELTFVRGEVQAKVQGRQVRPYSVRVRVHPFTDPEWDRVLDAVASQLGHTAALLDGELPPEVADDVASTGLDLLPGAGEVGTSCSCPDWADPCKHAAAVCYLIATASDSDPFVLLLLRGRGRDEVLAALRARRRPASAAGAAAGGRPAGAAAAGLAAEDAGVDARAVFAAPPSAPAPLPPLPAARPGQPVMLLAEPPGAGYPAPGDLLALAADAASRAWELAVGVGDGGLGLSVDADLARRAAQLLGTPAFAGLAAQARKNHQELAHWALAWRYGGAGGLDALRDDGAWVAAAMSESGSGVGEVRAAAAEDSAAEAAADSDAEADTSADTDTGGSTAGVPAELAMAAGKATLAERTGGRPRVTRNRVTSGATQLRLGRDRRWYPYAKSGTAWVPAGPPDSDPALAASVLAPTT
jgi:uncharacterized Zn finger protein